MYRNGTMSRIIAIDYGTKRVGIAVTDPLQIIASPLTTIERSDLDDFIDSYMVEEEVEQLVIGYPRHVDGTRMPLCKQIDSWVETFVEKHPRVTVHRTEESYTSVEAVEALIQAGIKKKKRRQKALIDRMSACLILKRYLQH